MTVTIRHWLVAAAVLGIAATVADYRSWSAEQRALAALLERADAARTMPGLAEQVARANDVIEAGLRATRPLVAQYVDPTWLFDVPQTERLDAWQRSMAALDEISALSATLMQRSPTSWEAAMVYGVVAYLRARGDNMARSSSRIDEWEVPLRHAEALIPGYGEPTRYLALAYVNYWQSLSSKQREAATATMTEAFRDQRTFALTVEYWLRYVPDRRRALSIIPDEPHAWRLLETIFKRRQEWALYVDCHARFEHAEGRRIDELLDEAEARVAGGDYRRGTRQYHAALATLEADGRNLERLRRALDRMPAGPVGSGAAESLRRWLEWALRLGFLSEPPLRPENMQRLAGTVADITLLERGLSSLMSADLAAAEQIERRWQGAFTEEWDRYMILKAEALLERGEVSEAQMTLQRVRGAWDHHPTYLRIATAVARATGDAGLAGLEAELQQLPSRRWRGHLMSWGGGTARLELLPAADAGALSIEFLEAPASGLPVDVSWNGSSTGRRVVFPGDVLEIEVDVRSEASLLEIRGADQRPFSPGLISLITSDS